MLKLPEAAQNPQRLGLNAPRTRQGRNRAVMVKNWPAIEGQLRHKFPLAYIWRGLIEANPGADISYKAFRANVRELAETMSTNSNFTLATTNPAAPPSAVQAAPQSSPSAPISPDPAPAPSHAQPPSQKERFRIAREAQQSREREEYERPARAKPSLKMVDGWEKWMTPFPRFRRDELIALNRKLQLGEVTEAEARPVLEAARREGWSKHTGIAAHQLREDQMNADHW